MSGVTRRTGLGALVGAVFGAPTAASEVKAKMSELMARQVMTAGNTKEQYMGDVAQTPSFDPIASEANRIEHIQQLTKAARGELNEYEKEELERYTKVYSESIPLKSVSKAYKNIMKRNKGAEREKTEWIDNAKKRLLRTYGINL